MVQSQPQLALCIALAAAVLLSTAPGANSESAAPVRVLALGDSLTNGAVPSLNMNSPYTAKLGQLMQSELSGRKVEIKTVGECCASRVALA
jgi:hypothetical protein